MKLLYNVAKPVFLEVKTMNDKMKELYSQIESAVKSDYAFENPVNLKDYAHLVRKASADISTPDGTITREMSIWSDAIEAAFADSPCLYIPKMDNTVFIDRPIVMHSGYKLKADPEQRICSVPNMGQSLVISDNILDGAFREVHLDNPTCDIAVEGGIWDALGYTPTMLNGNSRLQANIQNPMRGSFGMMIFSNVRDVIVKGTTPANAISYGVQICNCEGFYIEDIHFTNYHKDGIHVNGHVKNGIIRNLTGEDMGDDMVALNAWDWYRSALTYGNIENLIVENLKSKHNECRLLPGRKVYDDGSSNECAIRNCILRNIEGVYTFKLYGQPLYHDPDSDFSPIPGVIENVYFENISFPEMASSGVAGISVNALFDICADTQNLHFENIKILSTADEFKAKGRPMIKVGPLSETYTFGSDDPKDWKELFYPNHINTTKDTYINNVEFADRKATADDMDMIMRAIKLTVNDDYPNTKPKGGTGYGIIENVNFC